MPIETPLWMDPRPGEEQGPATSARQDRAIIAALFTEGVADLGAGDLRVRPRASGASMSVEVDPGAGYVAGDDVARQGTYRCVATTVESATIAGAPASGARIDRVVLRVADPAVVGGARQGAFVDVIPGTASSSPVPPSVPATALALARVRIAAGQVSITAGDISDERAQSGSQTLRGGSAAASGTTAQRDAEVNIDVGQLWLNATTGRLEIYGPSGWRSAEGYTTTQVFTASDTWTKPPRLRAALVTVIDGGAPGDSFGTGGNGGQHVERWIDAAALPATVAVTVAGAGGRSSFGIFVSSALDGVGSTRAGGSGGAGGAPSPNSINNGAPGTTGEAGSQGAAGGFGGFGGVWVNGGDPRQAGSGSPGTSMSRTRATGGGGGGGGGKVNTSSGNPPPTGGAGGPGGVPGGGGGAGAQGAPGGAGARGEVIVDMYF